MKENGQNQHFLTFIHKVVFYRWYVEPSDAMKQKVKAETEANLEKATPPANNTKSSSNIPHAHTITNTIKSPPEPASTVPTNTARVSLLLGLFIYVTIVIHLIRQIVFHQLHQLNHRCWYSMRQLLLLQTPYLQHVGLINIFNIA